MPARISRLLATTAAALPYFDEGSHCLFPSRRGKGCIERGLAKPTPTTQRRMQQREAEKPILYDMDPHELCASCASEWHSRVAVIMANRATEFVSSSK
jgi:hypothetical protein